MWVRWGASSATAFSVHSAADWAVLISSSPRPYKRAVMTHTNHMEPGPVENEVLLQKRLKEDATFREGSAGQEETSQKKQREGNNTSRDSSREDKLQMRLKEEAASQGGGCPVLLEDQLQKRLREEAAQRDVPNSRLVHTYLYLCNLFKLTSKSCRFYLTPSWYTLYRNLYLPTGGPRFASRNHTKLPGDSICMDVTIRLLLYFSLTQQLIVLKALIKGAWASKL